MQVSPTFQRLIGLTLISGAGIGLIMVVLGLGFVIVGLGSFQHTLDQDLAALDTALANTDTGLDTAIGILGQTNTALGSAGTALGGATSAISQTIPTLTAAADLAGRDLPATVRSTTTALDSAEQTAQLVDQVLRTISGFGLLGTTTYNPEVPLSSAINNVARSLDDLPAELMQLSDGLDSAGSDLGAFNRDLVVVTEDVDAIAAEVRRASGVMADYKALVADLRTQIANIRERLPFWFGGLRLGLGLGLIWLAIAQISLFLQGRALLRR
ncbi:MAG: hypothetical protein HC822_14075 [Oscillochloris sp.]|nr:hypothetical protein [Oscillochloris sp.]